MWICFPLPHGQKRCFWIPIYYEIPKFPRIPDPGPLHYGEMIADATILATVNEATRHIADEADVASEAPDQLDHPVGIQAVRLGHSQFQHQNGNDDGDDAVGKCF